MTHQQQRAKAAGWRDAAEPLRAAAAAAAGMAAKAAAGTPTVNSAAHQGASAPLTSHANAAVVAEAVLRTAPEPGPEPGPEPPGSAASPVGAADWLQRTQLLLGPEGLDKLAAARVLVVGLGGVGSYVAEFLVRAGVGHLAIVDGDVVDVTNKNRQLPALDSTVGQPKAEVMSRRLLDINPHLNLVVRQEFLVPDSAGLLLLDQVAAQLEDQWQRRQQRHGQQGQGQGQQGQEMDQGLDMPQEQGSTQGGSVFAPSSAHGPTPVVALDWVVDCIDSIAPKLALVAAAHRRDRMGASALSDSWSGGRLDPLSVHVADISETYGDSFAAHVRRGLRKTYGIREGVAVVFSTEPCRKASLALSPGALQGYKKSYYGTISFLPAIFGLHIAAHILNVIVDGPMLQTERVQRAKLRAARDAGTPGATKQQKQKQKGAANGATGAAAKWRGKRHHQQQQQGSGEGASSSGTHVDSVEVESVRMLGREGEACQPQVVATLQHARRPPLPRPALHASSWWEAVRAGDGNEGHGI
eukprot:XP_001692737.1 HesA/MoeB/ThiF family protein [Chlamydomonas reinhardtii]